MTIPSASFTYLKERSAKFTAVTDYVQNRSPGHSQVVKNFSLIA
ncbi:hypothetical protein [Phormidium nigroviride]